jgi:hypothetical protein
MGSRIMFPCLLCDSLQQYDSILCRSSLAELVSQFFFPGVVDCQDWDAKYYMHLVDKNGGGLN